MNKLICYGDSNSYGWDPTLPLGGRYERSWVEHLQELSGVACINQGLPGRRLPTQAAELQALVALLTSLRGDGLMILLGSNNRFLPPYNSPEETAASMDALLLYLRITLPELSLFLVGLPPMQLPSEDSMIWINTVNRYYAELAHAHSLPYFDPLPLGLPLCYDGVHLTAQGQRILAEGIWKAFFPLQQGAIQP